MSETSIEKVAGVVTLNINPYEQSLLRMEELAAQSSARINALTETNGRAQLALLENIGSQRSNLTAIQEAKILEIQQDGELKRTMAQMAFHKQMEQVEAEHQTKMRVFEQDAAVAREAAIQASTAKIMAAVQQSQAKTEAIAEESALRRKMLDDRIFQQEDVHEQRMIQLRANSELAQARLHEASLNQRLTMDKLHYQAIQEDALRSQRAQEERITSELRQIKAFYEMKDISASESVARVEQLLSEEAAFFAENEDKKLQAMRMAASMRQKIQAEELAADKLHYQALEENARRELAIKEENIAAEMRQIKSFYDLKLITAAEALQEIRTLMAEETAFFEDNVEKRIAAMKMEQQMKENLAKTGTGNGMVGNAVTSATQFAAGIAIFKVVEELGKIPDTIEDISGSMGKLKQVLELSDQIHGVEELNQTLEQLHQVSQKMAELYGVNESVVQDVMGQAGRRFKDMPSIIVATDNALQAMVADNVNAEKAIKGEEAMMAQFGLTLSETRDTWAKLTVASHEFLTDASGIIDAVERSGSAFHGMKVNSDGAIATIVALAQESGRTGTVVGNSWKSIQNTLGSQKGIEALHQLGIEAKSANGELMDGLTVLGKLQEKWPELSEESRQAFATVLAGGKYQYNQLLTFLNDTSGTFKKALDAMKTANTETQRQLVETALESLPKQAEITSANLQVMADKFSNALTPAMLTFYREIREGAVYIGDHRDTVEKLIKSGMTLAEGYIAWKVGLKLYTAAMESATVQTNIAAASFIKEKVAALGASEGVAVLTSKIWGLGTAAAQVVGRLAALSAAASFFNNIASRANDPLGAKEKDLQAQLQSLQTMKDGLQNPTFSSGLKASWDHVGDWAQQLNPFGDFDPAAAWKAYSAVPLDGGVDAIQKKIDSINSELKSVQGQKKDAQRKELQDMMDENEKMVQDMLGKAGELHPENPVLGNGSDNTIPDFSGAGDSASKFAQPFKNAVDAIEASLSPFIQMNKELGVTIDQLSDKQQNLADKLKYGATDMSVVSEATETYHQRLSALSTQQDVLHETNERMRAARAEIEQKMLALNPSGADPTSLSQGQQDALKALQNEYDQLGDSIAENSKKWNEASRSMVQATEDWLADIYQTQENMFLPLNRQMQQLDAELKTGKAKFSLVDSRVNYGDSSLETATQAGENYREVLKDLISKQDTLHQQADLHRTDINDLTYALNTLDQASAGYAAGVASLTSKINEHKAAVSDLQEQWVQATVDAQQYTENWLQQVYKIEDNGLKPLDRQVKTLDNSLKALKSQIALDDSKIKHHDTSDATLSDYATKYDQYVSKISEKQNVLTKEIEKHKDSIKELRDMLQTLDPASEGYAAAVQSLTDKIQEHEDAVASLDETVSQLGTDAQSAVDSINSAIIDGLKAGYEVEQKKQLEALEDQFKKNDQAIQNNIKSYNDQKDAIDENIKSLQDLWKAQDDQNKLDDLNHQRDQIMAQHDHEIVGLDGKLTYTYDVEKVTDLDKQIADEQTRIARDAQLKQLEDQKKALDEKIKKEQEASEKLKEQYDKDKQALDEYWNFRLQDDQLKLEADNLILKKGHEKALELARAFRDQMNATYAQIHLPDITAGGVVAGGLGGVVNAGGWTGTTAPALPSTPAAGSTGSPTTPASSAAASGTVNGHNVAIQNGHVTVDGYPVDHINPNSPEGRWAAQYGASLDTGGYIPRDGMAMLHQDEVVVNSSIVDKIRSMAEVPQWPDLSSLLKMPEIMMPDFSGLIDAIHAATGPRSVTYQFGDLSFPNVRDASDAQSFITELQTVIRLAAGRVAAS